MPLFQAKEALLWSDKHRLTQAPLDIRVKGARHGGIRRLSTARYVPSLQRQLGDLPGSHQPGLVPEHLDSCCFKDATARRPRWVFALLARAARGFQHARSAHGTITGSTIIASTPTILGLQSLLDVNRHRRQVVLGARMSGRLGRRRPIFEYTRFQHSTAAGQYFFHRFVGCPDIVSAHLSLRSLALIGSRFEFSTRAYHLLYKPK